jgi:hypothetical protein
MDGESAAIGWRDVDHARARLMLHELANEFHNILRHDEQRIEAENRKNLNVYAVPFQFMALQVQ